MTTSSQQMLMLGASGVALAAALVYLDVLTRPLVTEMLPECNSVLDLDFLLTKDKIRPFLECLGARGRSDYLAFYYFDFVIFPVVYAHFAYRVLLLAWREARPLLPLAVVAFDVLENSSIVFLLSAFPVRHEVVEELVPWLLRLKWTTLAAIVVSVATGVATRWSKKRGGVKLKQG